MNSPSHNKVFSQSSGALIDNFRDSILPTLISANELTRSLFSEIVRCDLSTSTDNYCDSPKDQRDNIFLANVLRILPIFRYDLIDLYHERATLTHCSNGVAFHYNSSLDLGNSAGNCFDLAVSARDLVQILFPDRLVEVAEDKQRPTGWNHFFVVARTVDTDVGKNNLPIVIDPSLGRVGYLSETASWDGSGKAYKPTYDFDGTPFVGISVSRDCIGNHRSVKIPLVSPRHFSNDLNVFGFALELDTYHDEPRIAVSKDGFNWQRTPLRQISCDIQGVSFKYKTQQICIPEELLTRVAVMWSAIKSRQSNFNGSVSDYLSNISPRIRNN